MLTAKGGRIVIFIIVFLSTLFFGLQQNLICQERGLKYLKNYTPEDYKLGHQNWGIVQDKRGIIYVGNNNGLLEFDGITWREIYVPNLTIRSLAHDENSGTIYVGGINEIGFLAPDQKGKETLTYVSLLKHLDKSKHNFSKAWRTYSTKEGIYFRTSTYLFRWNSGQLKVILETEKDNPFKASFICNGTIFLRREKTVLAQLVEDELKPIPGVEILADKKIFMTAPYDSQKLLLGTQTDGLYTYDSKEAKILPFETKANEYLKANQLSFGIRMRSGDFALGTRNGGVVIIDTQGKIKQIYSKKQGLPDNYVRYIFEDSQLNLWLGLDKGISKIEHVSPISIYDDRLDLPGIVLSVARYGTSNELFVGTTHGLYYLTALGKFCLVPGMIGNCYFLLSTGDSLLAAANNGVFQVESNRVREIIKNRSYILHPSFKDKKRIWVGTSKGLESLYVLNAPPGSKTGKIHWQKEHKFEKIDQEIYSIVEDKNGSLWLGTATAGVIKVEFTGTGGFTQPVTTLFDPPKKIDPKEVHVSMAAGHVMFATVNGIYRLSDTKQKLIPDFSLGVEFAGGATGVFRIVEDKNNYIWLHSESRNIVAVPQPDGTYYLNKKPFLRMPRVQANAIYPDPVEDAVWFAGNDGLIRFDKKIKKDYNAGFQTIIRKVTLNGELVSNGYKSENTSGIEPGRPIVIESKSRNLRFEFAAPFFEGEDKTQYRYILEGYETDWSDWTSESHKEYTNLDSGEYTFKVTAKNVYQKLGIEDFFHFKVLPPLYKTWWALTLYTLAFLLMMSFVVKWRSGKLHREKLRLEEIVKERTKEINEKSRQLEEQSEKLKEMDKAKSRFFANISHEFRTPLTLIIGPLEQLLSNGKDKGQQRKLNLMLKNSQRLLTLINQLLELSKFESGKMKLQASRQNIVPLLRGILASFESVTIKNELDLTFRVKDEAKNISLYFDPEKLEDIIFNLLSNAVKFTPPGGRITVEVAQDHADESAFPSGSVTISVSDTGPGIPRDQLGHIFDRFYQSDSTYEHHRKGSGIGLTIAKELVALHRGRIDVHSHEGKGTEFIFRLPMGKEHLEPGEIVELPGTKSAQKDGTKAGIMEIPGMETPETAAIEEGERFDAETLGKNIILVVEDNSEARDYIRESLEPQYMIMEAANGEEGIHKARELIPDLIISDIMMPDSDGYELCRVLKNDINTCHIPIILLTAKAAEEDILQGLETGADDYITKPFNTRILCARIKNLIDLRSSAQQTLNREMTLQPVKMSISQLDKRFLRKLKKAIDENLSDPDFNIEQLCKKMEMSQPTLYRKIHALSGESPTEFIRTCRLKRGAELLKGKSLTVLEVALEVGFSSANYFTKCFKKKFHQLPTTFKETESK